MLAQVDKWYVWMVINIYTAQYNIIIITQLWMMLNNYILQHTALHNMLCTLLCLIAFMPNNGLWVY